ncbi:MAG: AMMECR1 domain-containing protein [Acidobacteria bacterium]|nr:MAG: AMMECR1 domain-containing protein [Acidobacteriota bacterium]
MFTDAEKRALLEIARAAVIAQVTGRLASDHGRSQDWGQTPAVRLPTGGQRDDWGQTPDVPLHTGASGAFVTLKRNGELRGCLGTLECRRPLEEEVARLAASTSHQDPRFEPVRSWELADLHFEVSVLGPLEAIDPRALDAFVIGRHGLVVEQGSRRGLLLPQVATEWKWNREEFLAHTCRKAGLPGDAWQRAASVYRFDAEVFGD